MNLIYFFKKLYLNIQYNKFKINFQYNNGNSRDYSRTIVVVVVA